MSGQTAAKLSAGRLRRLGRADFIARFSGVFEHSPWVAEAAWQAAPFDNLESLLEAMVRACRAAPRERKLALIRAHPDLAGKAAVAGALTAESTREQAGAGLDRMTPEEYRRFRNLNAAYATKFGFPFILAVRGHDKTSILASYAERLENDPDTEFGRALDEIAKIARFRLDDLIET